MDTGERQAKLNTEVRFHNYANALPLALALRLELELLDRLTSRQEEQLETVQLRVLQLERITEPFYRRWGRVLWNKYVQPGADPPLPALTEADSALVSSDSNSDDES